MCLGIEIKLIEVVLKKVNFRIDPAERLALPPSFRLHGRGGCDCQHRCGCFLQYLTTCDDCKEHWPRGGPGSISCTGTPERPLCVITECHRHDMNDYAKLHAQFPHGSRVWQNGVVICEHKGMGLGRGDGRCRISTKAVGSSESKNAPS